MPKSRTQRGLYLLTDYVCIWNVVERRGQIIIFSTNEPWKAFYAKRFGVKVVVDVFAEKCGFIGS